MPGRSDNNGTYSRLNLGSAPVYDKCQHHNSGATSALPQLQHEEYSKLNVGQQTSSFNESTPIHMSQYSFVSRADADGIPLIQKGNADCFMRLAAILFLIIALAHKDLSVHVIPYLARKWREVGLALALTPPQLDDIEENHQGISDVFQIWEDCSTRPFTWDTLLSALRSSVVNEPELANKILQL